MSSQFRATCQLYSLALMLLAGAMLLFAPASVSAQQKYKYSFKAPPGTTKFT